MNEDENEDLSQYLDICQRSLQKYMSLGEEKFDVEHAILMLECNVICKMAVHNDRHGDMICFLCASICIDCLDPLITTSSELVRDKYARIYHYLRISQEGELHGNAIT